MRLLRRPQIQPAAALAARVVGLDLFAAEGVAELADRSASACSRLGCSAAEPCDRLVANRAVLQIVYVCLFQPSTCRSAHGRRGHRVSRAKPTPPARRPRGIPLLRAASAREDAAPQDHLREPRELA